MADMMSIVKEARAFVKTQQSNLRKQAMVGQDPDSYPGAERNSAVDASAKSPSPEVNDGTMGPRSSRSTDGAGDDSPKTRNQAMDATETVLTPAEKDVAGTDAMTAKTASLANSLIAQIRDYQKSAAAKPVEKPVEKKAEKDPLCTEAKVDEQKVDKKPAVAADAMTAKGPDADKPAEPKEVVVSKAASGLNLELTQDVLSKIASIVLGYDEGVQMVERVLTKEAGAQAARDVFGFLQTQNAELEKKASFEAGFTDGNKLIDSLLVKQGEKQAMAKQAAIKQAADQGAADALSLVSQLVVNREMPKASAKVKQAAAQTVFEKLGQAIADESAALPPELAEGGAMPEGMPEAAAAEMAAPEAGAGAEGIDPSMLENITPEDVVAAVQELVQSGQISPEEAQQFMQYLAQAAGGEGGMPGAEGMPEGAPEGEPVAEEAEAEGEPVAQEKAEKADPSKDEDEAGEKDEKADKDE